MDMDFFPDVPEEPFGEDDEPEGTEVLGVAIHGLADGATATGLLLIAKVRYEGLDNEYLSFRLSDSLPLWQAEQAARDALEWVLEMRAETGL